MASNQGQRLQNIEIQHLIGQIGVKKWSPTQNLNKGSKSGDVNIYIHYFLCIQY